MRTVAIIQARLGSSRLPRKTVALIQGRELVLHVVDRVAALRGLDDLIVAIPEHDDDLRAVLDREGVPVVLGPELDVLARFAKAAAQTDATTILRVTADCPLWCPEIGARVLQLYRETLGCDYAWNVSHGYIDGTDTEVFARHLLTRADADATEPAEREHVTAYIRRHAYLMATLSAGGHSHLKTSVDTAEDLARVRAIAARVSPGDYSFASILRAADACIHAV